ncbi:LexA repressor [Tepidanaerobacter acetatoxydans Re1]|uniref:LexA repressor n=1 Tax=Tepidanaerobacter acetatoxydans (strain DSM 21804 / JCM 16047 / Re1) TaxID=1209989 RepID=F4LUE5_TEPAE|nr:transcriptional repressor LexA [Tepidanaerobacter acetatoxydans]AEE91475.1 SOS-response transcriptional repressor, LexA [Tepidanaerobacter acetatoxydans Re1]CCP26183.1 LexA repressor [Tepidanaerobacter acetatoxydans Re1]
MYENLTHRQKQILDYIHNYFKTKGYPPSVREICVATNLKSTATVHSYLVQLEEKGYIKRDPQKPRAIEIMDTGIVIDKDVIQIPLVGKVTAGEPILAQENIENVFAFPKEMLPDANIFMLAVKGDSMIEAGILNGDYVMVQSTNTAKNGDIVVALLEDEATIKRFYKETDHIRLQPENRFMEPIIVKDLKILGKVVGLYRRF